MDRYGERELRDAVAASRNMRQTLLLLGCRPQGGNYETAWRRIHQFGISTAHWPQRTLTRNVRRVVPPNVLEAAVRDSRSIAQVLRELGLRDGGAARRFVRAQISAQGLDTRHFTGAGWRVGSRVPVTPRRPLDQVLVAGRYVPSDKLKRRLLDERILTAECTGCRRRSWEGKPIPLELDHINGNRTDNRIENLRLLCPNCHALTPTYRGRNIGHNIRGAPVPELA